MRTDGQIKMGGLGAFVRGNQRHYPERKHTDHCQDPSDQNTQCYEPLVPARIMIFYCVMKSISQWAYLDSREAHDITVEITEQYQPDSRTEQSSKHTPVHMTADRTSNGLIFD